MRDEAKITLVEKSVQQTITLQDVEQLLTYYKEITAKTGEQLNWGYGEYAFPYKLQLIDHKYYILASNQKDYSKMYFGVENDHTIVCILPPRATYGDKGKAVELCKFIAKKLAGRLQLFNGRTMYFYKR
ncbi:DUF1885 family protein [Bacillus sp. FJAT-47783]|uniref:DUF1885 family protein n=1 Tax=Bacillus sp. FJAT-47783 TaxID=2922712 RepID=UPI001FAD73C0|nr:DUF1885 family protein [Bacillus sp. FJAT-47783]